MPNFSLSGQLFDVDGQERIRQFPDVDERDVGGDAADGAVRDIGSLAHLNLFSRLRARTDVRVETRNPRAKMKEMRERPADIPCQQRCGSAVVSRKARVHFFSDEAERGLESDRSKGGTGGTCLLHFLTTAYAVRVLRTAVAADIGRGERCCCCLEDGDAAAHTRLPPAPRSPCLTSWCLLMTSLVA